MEGSHNLTALDARSEPTSTERAPTGHSVVVLLCFQRLFETLIPRGMTHHWYRFPAKFMAVLARDSLSKGIW